MFNLSSMLWGRPPKPNLHDVLRLLKTASEREIQMSAALDSLKSDLASLATEVAQAVSVIQANAAGAASAAADAAEIADLQTQVTALRDQLAAVLAAAGAGAPVA
jgi:hypothetical protein